MRAPILVLLFLGLVLAGCLGSDDDLEDEGENLGPRVTESTGSVWGIVLDDNLDPVAGALIFLTAGEQLVLEDATRADGEYALNEVPPGTYRIQVTAICCQQAVAQVSVEANKEIQQNFMVARYADGDLRTPYVEGPFEEEGFIACALILPAGPGVTCNQDPSHRLQVDIPVERGAKSVTVALLWEPTGPSPANEMRLLVENAVAGAHELGTADGVSPLFVRVDADDVAGDSDLEFSETDNWQLRLRARPGEGFVWQQPITFWYAVHYWHTAPQGYTPVPD